MRSKTSRTLPVSTASPEYMTVMRSQVSRMRPRLCEMNSIDVPNLRPRSLTSSTMPASTVTSSAVVGSSRRRRSGCESRAMRDDDALLLAAGKLVGKAVHHPLRVGQPDGLQHLQRALVGLPPADLLVDHRHFHQLAADLHRRIEARHRLLVDHRDLGAADRAQFLLRHLAHVPALEPDRSAGDLPDVGEVAHDAERHGRLAAAGFADEPHRLARHHLAGEIHHRRDFRHAREERDVEIADFKDRLGHVRVLRLAGRRSNPAIDRRRPAMSLHSRCREPRRGIRQSRSDCSRSASASRLRPSTKVISASAGGSAGCT